MSAVERKLSTTFERFFNSEKAGGAVLIVATLLSLAIANTGLGEGYQDIWQWKAAGLTLEHWINDGLMAIFFLRIGLELERELYSGELSDLRNAVLPIAGAIGGICLPALIHYALNVGTRAQAGMAIPMATDIAFALGILALVGRRVPASLKVFLTALAVMDDLGAIIVIAVFYTKSLSFTYLLAAFAVLGVLVLLNRLFGVMSLAPYVVGGAVMWFLMLKSGVHATIAGVLLAFAIPYSALQDDETSPSHRLEDVLHRPVTFLILPVFALANTSIAINGDWLDHLTTWNSIGIFAGLVAGKPIGIALACFAVVTVGLARLPLDLAWRHIVGAGLLGGIGFTMSIFVTNLAFTGDGEAIAQSKMAILAGSLTAGLAGFLWLAFFGKPTEVDTDPGTMDSEL